MKTAKLRLPTNLTTRKCWIGSYGGHFDIVIVFNKKPQIGPKEEWDDGTYSSYRNKKILAGTFDCDSFNEWFGTDIKPTETNCISVEEYELTACWDEYGRIIGLDPYADQFRCTLSTMKNTTEKLFIFAWGLLLALVVVGCPAYKIASGQRLQWSPLNGKFIWVDQEGKP